MRDKIIKELKAAESSQEQPRLSMLRLISSAISDKENVARAAGRSAGVSDDTIREIVNTMIRQREKSAVGYEEHGQLDLAESERDEMAVLKELLPRQLSSEEVCRAVDRAIRDTRATGIRHKGRVMSALKSKYPGRMNFRFAGEQVVERLSRPPAPQG